MPELADGEDPQRGHETPRSGRPSSVPATSSWSRTVRWSTSASTSPSSAGPTPADSATKLAQLVGVDPAAYASRSRRPVPRRSFRPSPCATTATGPSPTRRFQAIPGGRAIPDTLPLAPTRTFARALLGTAAEASAEQIEKSGGALKAGDTTGTGGLQQQYDAQLRGTDGIVVRAQKAGLTAEEIKAAPTDPRRVLFRS